MIRSLISVLSALLLIVPVFADINTDFIRACRQGDLQKVKELSGKGAFINAKDGVSGWTGLHWAVYTGNSNLVRYLIEKEADITVKDNTGLTALELASNRNDAAIISLINDLAVIDVDVNIPEGRGVFGEDSIGIFIGNGSYDNGIPSVDFAVRDAETVRSYFIKTFGIKEDNTLLLKNITRANFDGLFGNESDYTKSRLYRKINTAKFDVVIYYSGHGAPSTRNLASGKGFLVPSDADIANIDVTGYAMDTLVNNLDKMKKDGVIGRIWLVFDCCFSGDSGGGMLLKNVSPVGIKVENPLVNYDNSLVIYSSRGNEVSSWYRQKKHGLFTYFLLKAFGGDAVKNKSKGLTAADLKGYIDDTISKWALKETGHTQTPQVICKDSGLVLIKYK